MADLSPLPSFKENFELYQAAINTPALGFWIADMQGRFLQVNDAYVRQSGYSRSELLEMSIPHVEAMEKPEETAAHIARIIKEGYARFRSEHRRKDGSVWPVEIVTTYSQLLGGRLIVFIEDLSEKVAQEAHLQLAARVFATMEQAVVVTDAANRIVSINPATTRITGYTLEEIQGKDPRIFSSGRHDRAFYATMWEALKSCGHWQGEIWDRRKDGEVYAKWLTINAIRDSQKRLIQYVSVFSDISDRKKTEEVIWRHANFDALTSLPNRYLLYERLEQEILKAQRFGEPLAILFIDLDRFKEVNDSLGHAKGDRLLVLAARRISGHFRDTDTIARLGGDEFTVILPGFGSRSDLERLVQGLIRKLAEPYDLGNGDMASITASVGITLYPDDADDREGLIKHADQAMYVAKGEGRNRFGYFTESMQQKAREKLALSNDLRLALEKGELEVYFQPIVEMRNEGISKAEALLRWHHPRRGSVSPEIFIPIAEENGLIHDLGEWVFQRTIDCIQYWRERYGRLIQVSVNKSPLQFERPHTSAWMESLTQLGLPGSCIIVEITESSLLSKSPRIKESLLAYREAGIEVSIDDFGTGFSALSYLHRFDIDYLKIDRSFVCGLAENAASTTLIEAIIVMAHKLGIKTIAEGVETEAQKEMLKSFGCDYVQGYFYARPQPAEEFEKLIAAARE